MRLFIAMLVVATLVLSQVAVCQLIDPVEFDGSQAIEMEVKWSWQTGETSSCYYVRNLAGIPNNNVLFFYLSPEKRSWRTYPLLDTHNVSNTWPYGGADLHEFDYDGIEPLEYINRQGYVFRFSNGLDHISVLDTIDNSDQVRFSSDVNGDGIQDIVYQGTNSDVRWQRVIFAGPDMGKGFERALELPRYFTT